MKQNLLSIVLGVILFIFLGSPLLQASSAQDYLKRFMAYEGWNQNLPQQPGADFLAFVDSDTPLAKKLREQWLYQLVRQKDWSNYSKHYKLSKDVNLQCYNHLANYYQGHEEEAMNAAKRLWLNGGSLPQGCNSLLGLLVKSRYFNEQLITQRIILALEKQNLPLARYLLKQYKPAHTKDEQLLTLIGQNPSKIILLGNNELHPYFYLYGLKRLVSINMNQAINYWELALNKKQLSPALQQAFLVHLTLYKAMRNNDDTQYWFAKINPAYYSDALLDWQVRYALKRQKWAEVQRLLQYSHDKEEPCWQYWLARSLEARGDRAKAHEIYEAIAKSRHYYGFLASLRLNKTPNFEEEAPVNNQATLKVYQPITERVQLLYRSKREPEASRLLNDFISELPKEDKSTLIYWVANDLQWHSKSVFLSNNDELSNQLMLRFPLAYRTIVTTYAKNYDVRQELIYAIIRQESGFREDVVSPAGARGLMQVMPATASVIAKSEKIAYGDKAQLFLFHKNINLGVAYLRQLAKRFNKHPVLIAAAYNAGPRQVNYWLKNHSPRQMDIWIETLPWRETRNYLKNIIAFHTVYQYRMRAKPDLGTFMKPVNF